MLYSKYSITYSCYSTAIFCRTYILLSWLSTLRAFPPPPIKKNVLIASTNRKKSFCQGQQILSTDGNVDSSSSHIVDGFDYHLSFSLNYSCLFGVDAFKMILWMIWKFKECARWLKGPSFVRIIRKNMDVMVLCLERPWNCWTRLLLNTTQFRMIEIPTECRNLSQVGIQTNSIC